VASPGMLVSTRPLPPLTDRVVYLPGGPGPPVHLRQRAEGSVPVGERTQETSAAEPGLRHARALLAQAARAFPTLGGVGVDRWWLAYRAMPADHLRGPGAGPAGRPEGRRSDFGRAPGPFRPGRFAERVTRVMLEVESVFREPPRQDRST
jgi:hypothetical protein